MNREVRGCDFRHARRAQVTRFKPRSTLGRFSAFIFSYCKSVKAIGLPASLEMISGCRFLPEQEQYFPVLETVPFEPASKLHTIESYAFFGCSSLKTFCVPASVRKLGGSSFMFCHMRQLEIESRNRFCHIKADFLMDMVDSHLIRL